MIPFNKAPYVEGAEEYVLDVIKSRHLMGDGPYTIKDQEILEEKTNCRKVFLTHTGTDALEFACLLADIGPGDEVIVPSFTFPTTAACITLFHGTPVFIDCHKETMAIDETKIEAAITERIKAIMVMHYAGVGCEMEKICEIAKEHGLLVIEDAAQVLGAKWNGKALGTFGDIGCISFHQTKNYTMGEGGAIFINNPDLIDRAYILRDSGTNAYAFEQGLVPAYTWVDKGSSYMPSELQAAYLYPQMLKFDEINKDRVKSFWSYYEKLKDLKETGKLDLPFVPKQAEINGHMFYVKTKDFDEMNALRKYLKSKDIYASFHYQPLHSAKAGRMFGRFVGEDINTTAESRRILRLPMFYGLTEEEITEVANAIHEFYNKQGDTTK